MRRSVSCATRSWTRRSRWERTSPVSGGSRKSDGGRSWVRGFSRRPGVIYRPPGRDRPAAHYAASRPVLRRRETLIAPFRCKVDELVADGDDQLADFQELVELLLDLFTDDLAPPIPHVVAREVLDATEGDATVEPHVGAQRRIRACL